MRGISLAICAVVACSGPQVRQGPVEFSGAANDRGGAGVAAPDRSLDVQPYALTLSGGVSLGSYMAGLDWALIEMMRLDVAGDNPDLIGVTGASAGGINALVSAMRWCEDDALLRAWLEQEADRRRKKGAERDRFLRNGRNLFAATWLAVDLRDLLPADQAEYAGLDDPNRDPDSMLSRKKGYGGVIRTVEERLVLPIYRRGCSLKLGMTVTRTRPRTLTISGIAVDNQRFVIPLQATVDDHNSLYFTVDTGAAQSGRSDLLGNLLFLTPQDSQRMRVDSKVVVRAAQASSAFPVALGPVELTHCVPSAQCSGQIDPWGREVCSAVRYAVGSAEPLVSCAEPFVDGGVFDNVPLGVAMAQIESSSRLQDDVEEQHDPGQTTPASFRPYRPLRYLYVEYGNRRKPERPRALARSFQRAPLRETLDAIGGFLDTAQDYELHNVLRYNTWNESATALLAREVADLIEKSPRRHEVFTGGACPAPLSEADCLMLAVPTTSSIPVGAAVFAALLRKMADQVERSLLTRPPPQALRSTRDHFKEIDHAILRAVYALCMPQTDNTVSGTRGREVCDGRDRGRRLASQARALLEGGSRELLATSRLSPLAGTHATHFAALLDLPLREYDFYAGIYDGIWTHAEMACDVEQRKWVIDQRKAAKELGWTDDDLVRQRGSSSPDAQPPAWPGRRACLDRGVANARAQLGVQSGAGLGGEILDALVEVENAHRYGGPLAKVREPDERASTAMDDAGAMRVMRALFDPLRCPADQRTRRNVCLSDLEFDAFAASLERHHYQPGTAFMKWALDHPAGDEWWLLPGSYATERMHGLAQAEARPGLFTMATAAAVHVESQIDDVDRSRWVAPSSLPDRLGRAVGLFFPFLALSVHPSRRVELGLIRGGVRINKVDLLADSSLRVMVVPPAAGQEDEIGYGLFTRGFTALTASVAPTYRFGQTVFSTLAVRAGLPARVPKKWPEWIRELQPLASNQPWEEEVNFELVLTMFDSKFRAAVGCQPWEAEPNRGCWRHPYYSFGVNDLLGVGYWAGINPFQWRRFLFPFVAPRLALTGDIESGRDQAIEVGLLRGGWGRGDGPAFDIDLSTVVPALPWYENHPDLTVDASASLLWRFSYVALEALGLRAVLPLSVQHDARFSDANLEAFFVSWKGLRGAVGWFPDPIEDERGRDLPAWYASLGIDFDHSPAADWW